MCKSNDRDIFMGMIKAMQIQPSGTAVMARKIIYGPANVMLKRINAQSMER